MGRVQLRRAIDPRVRLEVIDGCGARTAFYIIYITVAVAVALVVVLKLGLTFSSILLSGSDCGKNGTAPTYLSGGTAVTACTLSEPTPGALNTTVWTGTVSGLSTLDGDVAISVVPHDPQIIPLSFEFSYDAELYGRRLSGEVDLLIAVVNASVTLQCEGTTQSGACQPSQVDIIDTSELTNGLGSGGFVAYTARVTYHNVNLTASGHFGSVTYYLSYQTAAYRVSDLVARSVLLCITGIVLFMWLRALAWQRVWVSSASGTDGVGRITREYVPSKFWLPQQHLVTLLLISTILWLDPIFVATELVPEMQVAASVRVASLVLQSIGWGALFTFWWGLVDGFKITETKLREILLHGDESGVFPTGTADPAPVQVNQGAPKPMPSSAPLTYGSAMAAKAPATENRVASPAPTGLPRRPAAPPSSLFRPPSGCCRRFCIIFCCLCRLECCAGTRIVKNPAHPLYRARAFSGRLSVVSKVTFFLAYTSIAVFLQLLAQPTDVLGLSVWTGGSPQIVLDALVAVGAAYVALQLLWTVLFSCTVSSTSRQLRHLPYSATRYAQLSFRYFWYNNLVVILFVLAVNLVPVVTFLISATAYHGNQVNTTQATARAKTVSQIIELLRLVAQGGVTPLGESLLVSVYAWMLAFMYTPPLHYSATSDSSGTAVRNPLERAAQAALSLLLLPADAAALISSTILSELRPIATAMIGASDPKSHLFSVSCASWLYDFACAVYFDLPGLSTPSSYGPIPCMPHDFETEAVIIDPVSDTIAWVGRHEHRVVVCFRGTSSQANVSTDLNFAQDKAEFAEEISVASTIPGVRQALPLVHVGFSRAYMTVRQRLRSAVSSALASAGARGRLYCTGHSLGGALASLAAYDLQPLVSENRRIIESFSNVVLPKNSSKAVHPTRTHAEPQSSIAVGSATLSRHSNPAVMDATAGLPFKPQQGDASATVRRTVSVSDSHVEERQRETESEGNLAEQIAQARHYAAGRRPTQSVRLASSNVQPPSSMTSSVEATRAALTALVNDPVSSAQAVVSRIGNMFRSHRQGATIGGVSATRPTYDDDARLRSAPLMGSRGSDSPRSPVVLIKTEGNPSRESPLSSVGTSVAEAHSFDRVHLNTSSGTLPQSDYRKQVESREAVPPNHVSAIQQPSAQPPNSSTLTGMLLDDDVLEGADPLDCCGLPPAYDPILNDEEDEAAAAVGIPGTGSLYQDDEGRPAGRPSSLTSPPSPLRASVRQSSNGNIADSLGRQFSSGLGASTGGPRTNRGFLSRLLLGRKPSELDVTCYTFGSPRIGNRTFSRLYNSRVPNTFRVVYDGDLVTGVPTWWYKHVGIQVWLDAWGNSLIDPSYVEKSWILSSKTSVSAHRMSSYRRGLIFARRYEGLPQYRVWAQEHFVPRMCVPEDIDVDDRMSGANRAMLSSPVSPSEGGPSTSVASALNRLATMQQGDNIVTEHRAAATSRGAVLVRTDFTRRPDVDVVEW